jgi:hypothetical protein
LLSAIVAAICTSSPCFQARAELAALVPMYVYPAGSGLTYWNQLDSSASKINIDAIVNPASGPGMVTDPNYVAAINNLIATPHGEAFGYISSNFGHASLSQVESDINGYITLYGGAKFSGFFIDQMYLHADLAGNPSTLSFYQSIYSYIKGLNPSYSVIANPGSPFLNGLSESQYLSTANQFVIFEGPNKAPSPGAPGFDAYPYGLNWFQKYSSSRFANIVFDVPADSGNPSQSAAMLSDLQKAYSLNAGSFFITDATLPNPYDHLPSYWDQEVAAISRLPEPSSLVMASTCALAGIAALALRRRRRDATAE